jgi:hypothetical protein
MPRYSHSPVLHQSRELKGDDEAEPPMIYPSIHRPNPTSESWDHFPNSNASPTSTEADGPPHSPQVEMTRIPPRQLSATVQTSVAYAFLMIIMCKIMMQRQPGSITIDRELHHQGPHHMISQHATENSAAMCCQHSHGFLHVS